MDKNISTPLIIRTPDDINNYNEINNAVQDMSIDNDVNDPVNETINPKQRSRIQRLLADPRIQQEVAATQNIRQLLQQRDQETQSPRLINNINSRLPSANFSNQFDTNQISQQTAETQGRNLNNNRPPPSPTSPPQFNINQNADRNINLKTRDPQQNLRNERSQNNNQQPQNPNQQQPIPNQQQPVPNQQEQMNFNQQLQNLNQQYAQLPFAHDI